MRFMCIVKADKNSEAGRPPSPELIAAIGKLNVELTKAGVLLETGGLLPSLHGVKLRLAGGKVTATDGPFVEAKEVIGGYAILQVNSKEEAIELGKRFMQIHAEVMGPAHVLESEIRPMIDPSDPCHNLPQELKVQLNPYLYFNGQCEAAFKFYEKCLGGKIEAMFTHAGTPAEAHVPPEWRTKILHARLAVGDQVLMASDAPPGRYETQSGFSVSLQIKDPAEAERIFEALVENGTVRMPFQQTFWAFRFGMLVDRFGIPWMINCEKAPC